MKKRLTAWLLCAALAVTLQIPGKAAFTDISDSDTAIAAATLQGLGVVDGTGNSTFDPNGTLTRAQACKMIVETMGLGSQVNTYSRKTLFSDVTSSAWYNGYVNLAYSKGVINGYGNGTFGPNDSITYGQLATILLRMLGYTSARIGSVWPLDYTAFCEDLGLADGLPLSPMKPITRAQAAVLIYRAVKQTANGANRAYYETMEGVASTGEAILLDVAASYGGSAGLLMVYSLDGSGGTEYYTQANAQSDALVGSVGTLLFNGSGKVCGFIPLSSGYQDLQIGSATASTLKSAGGTSYRISSGAIVVSGGEVYPYQTSGYLQVNAKAGKNVRLYYKEDGTISHLYLTGGTAASSEAAVAESASISALARKLGISNQNYTITKNGAAATADALAQYDVGYYDGASGTLRLSDYRVTGYLSAATPSVTAASSITVAGHSFPVLECAWDGLGGFSLGDKVTLLLTDDGKVAAVEKTTSKLTADMIGVLDPSGHSVTLVGSGIVLSAADMDYDERDLGSLVKVTAASSLTCKGISTTSGGKLDIAGGTLGDMTLASSCAIYEWAGSGYVYDLEGNRGEADSDFSAIGWADSLASSYISYYHTNTAGQVDILLLKNVTGNCYTYGEVTIYPEGISLGVSGLTSTGATVENSSGVSEKYLSTVYVQSGSYVGVALGKSSQGYGRIAKVQTLTKLTGVSVEDFFQRGGVWYVETAAGDFPISERVEIYISGADTWLSGEDGLLNVLADGYSLTLYYDRALSEGGQIRLIQAK